MSIIACKWPECGRLVGYPKHGLCNRCYQRAYKHGNFVDPWLTYRLYGVPEVAPSCKWVGCEKLSACAGFCGQHYKRSRVLGNSIDPWLDWDTTGTCEVCGKTWNGARNRNKSFCSGSCYAKSWQLANPEHSRTLKSDAVRRRRARIAGVEVDHFTTEDVRMARGDDCYLCGDRINYRLRFPHPLSPSLDHVIPISAGGSHSLQNVAMAHMGCNNKKNARPTKLAPFETLFTT